MKKKHVGLVCVLALAALFMTGCKKEEAVPVETAPKELVLTPVSINEMLQDTYYVKNGAEFTQLQFEGCNFDVNKPIESTTRTEFGMVDKNLNRMLTYVLADNAIPTLYKNDQLVFKSSGNVPYFTWERYEDQGYSIGLFGLEPTGAGKVQYGKKSGNASRSSISMALGQKVQEGMNLDNGFVIDKINGTSLTKDNIRSGGLIAGLTKDAIANCDIYVGTTLVSATAAADMRAFTSFELYTTELYNNSPDGYAIIDIPEYLKSGYYLINNRGLVKYYNVERGTDTTQIDLADPYYYAADNGHVMTEYEYLEYTGATKVNKEIAGGVSSLEDTTDVINFNTDVTQKGLGFTIAYKYHTEKDEITAKQTGRFPRVILVSPTGTATELAAGRSNYDDEWTYMQDSINGAVAGTWQLRFYNFEDIYRTITTDIASGNAKSFIHTGSTGKINIHYEASSKANDLTITWQKSDRAADIIIRTPDRLEYSKQKTPGNVMMDEYGKVVFKLPNLIDGYYEITVKGSDLGRVWIDCEESVSLNTEQNGVPVDTNQENGTSQTALTETTQTKENTGA